MAEKFKPQPDSQGPHGDAPVTAAVTLVDHARLVKGKLRLRVRQITIRDGLVVAVGEPQWREE